MVRTREGHAREPRLFGPSSDGVELALVHAEHADNEVRIREQDQQLFNDPLGAPPGDDPIVNDEDAESRERVVGGAHRLPMRPKRSRQTQVEHIVTGKIAVQLVGRSDAAHEIQPAVE